MKRLFFLTAVLCFFSLLSYSGLVPYNYYDDFLYASPGTYRYGLLGYINPANLAVAEQPELMFSWVEDADKYGLFTALPKIGFGVIYDREDGYSVKDFRVSAGFGDRKLSIGFGYGWSLGDTEYFARDSVYTLGLLFRPVSSLSLGISSSFTGSGDREAVFDIGLRPFNDERFTLFGDFMVNRIDDISDDRWSAGIAYEPVKGMKITGRYMSDEQFTLGMVLSFGKAGIGAIGNFNEDSDHTHNAYSLRLGGRDKCLLEGVKHRESYLSMELLGEISYRKFAILDDRRTLWEILSTLEKAKLDDNIAGIAINMSGMSANSEMIWEIRYKLEEFRNSGKYVVIYIDNASISTYHLASVADRIVMDPMGRIVLEGYSAGRTFYRGLLEKLGLGFDEWRFFSYKSAAESFSRDSMSECDKEQRQRMIDLFYETAREDIAKSRGISQQDFDNMVDNTRIFDSKKAMEYGLADIVGRFDRIRDIIGKEFGKKPALLDDKSYYDSREIDHAWGEKPVLAVVYALGGTDMDSGIKARELQKTIRKLKDDSRVKAIVMRVDSPGGDGLASDLVAEATKECKGIKPFIISQGQVAASGGYWISMNGDVIVTAPFTITGSIGVIGGWLYNKDFKDKTGFSYDIVKRGSSSDLGKGIVIPLLEIEIPDRNLTEEEYRLMEENIRAFYDTFVSLVSEARKRPYEEIEKIAQGRIWIGADALEKGLVDEIGGLEKAIDIALEKADLTREDVRIVEYPKMGLVNLSDLIKFKLFGIKQDFRGNPFLEDILLRIKYNGMPLPILSVDYYNLQM